jgi:uncharacterized repeat protein (TIGR01451 family)
MPIVAPITGSVRRRLLVVLLAVMPASYGSESLAAIAMIQHAGRDAGTTTSSTLAFPSANTAGNFLAVAIRAGGAGQNITVIDTRGNTYRLAAQVNLTLDGVTLGLYYAENIAGGANTVTVSDTLTGRTLRFAIFEYSGIATASSLDGSPPFAEGTSTSAETPPLTPGANGDLILGMLSTADSTTHTAGSGFVMQERVPFTGTKLSVEDRIQASAGSITATGSFGSSQRWAALVAAFTAGAVGPPTPDLTIAKSHSESFIRGQTGATYLLTASNQGGEPTIGSVTVTDTLPSELTATAFSGSGWSCTLPPLTCTRSDALGSGLSYPAITLTVNVSSSAPSSVTNTATVSGGGETNTGNDTASDPATIAPTGADTVGQWSAVQNWPVVAVHASLLPTGKVLAWTDYTINNGAQVWTPGTGNFTAKNYATTSLFCSGHAFLPDGRLLIAGGIVGLSDSVGPRESTFFDPVTETFSPGPLMSQGRYYPSTTTLPDGRVLVMAGVTTCSTCIADRPEVYDPATNTWTDMADSARTTIRFYPHNYVLPDGRVLAAAHGDAAASTTVIDLTTQTWTTVDSRITDAHSSAMYLPGKVVKCGTATQDNEGHPAAATTYVLDMTQPTPQWQATAPMAFPRSFHNMTVLPDGQVLVTGGSTTTDKANYAAAVYAAELWSPTTLTWTTMSSADRPRLYHSTALLLPDATVLVAGGGRRNGRSQPDPRDQQNAETFSPPYLFKGPRPSISSAPGVLTYGTSFTVDTPDASRIANVSLIALSSATHSYNENQRFVPLTFTAGTRSLTVQAPGSGSIAPPGPYMLFLVDNVGVPSVATMVRVSAFTGGPLPSGRIPGDLAAESQLTVGKLGTDLVLSWGQGCLASDADSEIYEGTIGTFTSHASVTCSTGGALAWTLTPVEGDRYYLVVPTNLAGEGSYGLDGAGLERPAALSACRVQSVEACP